MTKNTNDNFTYIFQCECGTKYTNAEHGAMCCSNFGLSKSNDDDTDNPNFITIEDLEYSWYDYINWTIVVGIIMFIIGYIVGSVE